MSQVLDATVPAPAASGGARFAEIIRVEWVKFVSLRSYRYLMLATVVLAVGVGLLFTLLASVPTSSPEAIGIDPMGMSFASQGMARLTMVVIGCLMITSEFGSGQVLSTFAVTPRRWRILAAKAVVLTAAGMGVGVVSGVGLLFAARVVFNANDIPVTTPVEDQVLLVACRCGRSSWRVVLIQSVSRPVLAAAGWSSAAKERTSPVRAVISWRATVRDSNRPCCRSLRCSGWVSR